MSQQVWAYSESGDLACELMSAALEIAGKSGWGAVVVELGKAREEVEAETKLVVRGTGEDPLPEVAAEALSRAARSRQPSLILVGATRDGREVASRVAARLGWPCLSEASKLSAEGAQLQANRSVFAGKVVATVSCALPAVVTVKPASFPRSSAPGKAVEELDVGEVTGAVKLLSRKRKEAGTVDLRKAKTIVSAGRGVKRKEDLPMLQSLAEELGGALGCSRPLSSDLGWLPEECHIGLTGVTVRPDLYVAVGISGQLQHIAGMKDSKVVVAVNTDKDAPIFQASDYGIVADLYQVVPALKKALESRR